MVGAFAVAPGRGQLEPEALLRASFSILLATDATFEPAQASTPSRLGMSRGRLRGARLADHNRGAEPEEFDVLYRTHQPQAYRTALLICAGERTLAEDVVSEAFARVFVQWDRSTIDNFGAYLRQAVLNETRGIFRRRRLERADIERRASELDITVEAGGHVELRDELWTTLRLLPLSQRTAIVLHYYEDLSIEEIARLTSKSVGTVKSLLSRGRSRLAELLGDDGFRSP